MASTIQGNSYCLQSDSIDYNNIYLTLATTPGTTRTLVAVFLLTFDHYISSITQSGVTWVSLSRDPHPTISGQWSEIWISTSIAGGAGTSIVAALDSPVGSFQGGNVIEIDGYTGPFTLDQFRVDDSDEFGGGGAFITNRAAGTSTHAVECCIVAYLFQPQTAGSTTVAVDLGYAVNGSTTATTDAIQTCIVSKHPTSVETVGGTTITNSPAGDPLLSTGFSVCFSLFATGGEVTVRHATCHGTIIYKGRVIPFKCKFKKCLGNVNYTGRVIPIKCKFAKCTGSIIYSGHLAPFKTRHSRIFVI